MEHHDGQAEQALQERQAKNVAEQESTSKTVAAIMKDNEILVCLKYNDQAYWKKAKLSNNQKDLNNIWDALLIGLVHRLEKVGHFPKRKERTY